MNLFYMWLEYMLSTNIMTIYINCHNFMFYACILSHIYTECASTMLWWLSPSNMPLPSLLGSIAQWQSYLVAYLPLDTNFNKHIICLTLNIYLGHFHGMCSCIIFSYSFAHHVLPLVKKNLIGYNIQSRWKWSQVMLKTTTKVNGQQKILPLDGLRRWICMHQR